MVDCAKPLAKMGSAASTIAKWALVLAVLGPMAVPGPLAGQSSRGRACAKLVALETGQLTERELIRLIDCGAPGGAAIGRAVAATASTDDATRLAAVAKASLRARDSSILAGAIRVTRDTAARPMGRLNGLFIALAQVEPLANIVPGMDLASLFDGDTTQLRCGLTADRRRPRQERLSPLPPAAPWLVFQAANAIASSSGPASVRLFARCVAEAIDKHSVVEPLSVTGVVQDTAGQPLANAEVLVLSAGMVARTNASGRFRLNDLLPGPELLLARSIGYRPERIPVTLVAGDTVSIEITLGRAVQQLEELKVTAYGQQYTGRLAEFARRMLSSAAPRSSFIGPEEIEEWARFDFANVFRRAGLIVSGNRVACPASELNFAQGGGMHVYLDDALINTDPTFDLTGIPVRWVAAIEVYRRMVEAPIQYTVTGARCVVLMTTRY